MLVLPEDLIINDPRMIFAICQQLIIKMKREVIYI